MAGAFLARPDDATAASWNPAGLSYLRIPEVSVATLWGDLQQQTRAAGQVTRELEDSGWSPDFVAATWPIAIGPATGAVQVGFQRVISFNYDRTIAQEESLRTIDQAGGFDVVAIASGLQVSNALRFGLAINRWRNGYEQSFERTQSTRPSSQSVDFRISGWSFNLGGIWSPVESLNLGAVLKSSFTASAELTRERKDFDEAGNLLGSASWESDDLEVDFPMAFGFGASWRPRSPLTFSADYTRTDWSESTVRNYFVLKPQRPEVPGEDVQEFEELPYPSLIASQVDTEQFRMGVEYVVFFGRVRWPLRAGYFTDRQLFRSYDPATRSSSTIPSLHGFAAGTGIIIGRVLADIAWVYEWGDYREAPTVTAPDIVPTVDVRSHRIFISFIYRHR